jgi:AcrR family transcriptional regulator
MDRQNNSDHRGVLVRYQRIVDELRQQIADGRLRPGERVPSARAITREWGVAIATATKVLAALSQEGLVRAVPGVGTVVAPRREQSRERELSKERIVETAIRIADSEGLAALSMRRVAAELGAATMSLYRHVPGKEELVLLMMDSALGEESFPDHPPKGWRPRIEIAAELMWRAFRKHRWLAGAMSVARPQMLVNALKFADWVLKSLDGLGLDANRKLYVHVTLFSFVRGVALSMADDVDAEQDTGVDADTWMETQVPALTALNASGQYSAVADLAAYDLDFDLEGVFQFGLKRMLDGVESWLRTARQV